MPLNGKRFSVLMSKSATNELIIPAIIFSRDTVSFWEALDFQYNELFISVIRQVLKKRHIWLDTGYPAATSGMRKFRTAVYPGTFLLSLINVRCFKNLNF